MLRLLLLFPDRIDGLQRCYLLAFSPSRIFLICLAGSVTSYLSIGSYAIHRKCHHIQSPRHKVVLRNTPCQATKSGRRDSHCTHMPLLANLKDKVTQVPRPSLAALLRPSDYISASQRNDR